MNETKLRELYAQLENCYLDLKAEVLIAELFENTNISTSELDVFYKSSFSRGYRRDIIDSKYNENNKIQVTLSRNGIYDSLPQGIFHKAIPSNTNTSYSELRQASKKEEKDARMLFTPIENEFFLQRVAIEQNEKKLIRKFNNLDNSFLLDFWEIKDRVAAEYVFSLAKLLPLASKISKSKELMAQCLSKILNEKVNIVKDFLPIVNTSEQNDKSEPVLGVNTTLESEQTSVLYPHFNIEIQLKELKNKLKFTKNGIGRQLISVFCEYFVPLEINWDVKITFQQSEPEFDLSQEHTFLGLSTTI